MGLRSWCQDEHCSFIVRCRFLFDRLRRDDAGQGAATPSGDGRSAVCGNGVHAAESSFNS
jgi:hypothetical protein